MIHYILYTPMRDFPWWGIALCLVLIPTGVLGLAAGLNAVERRIRGGRNGRHS